MSTAYTENIGPQLFGITIALPALSTLIVTARIYACAFKLRKFRLDDYLIIAALITSLLSVGFLIPSITSGLGQPTAKLSASAVTQALKWLFAATTVRVTALYLAKLSVAASFLSIRKTKNTARIVYVIAGLLSVSWIFSYVVIFAQCVPLSRKWQIFRQDIREKGKCWDVNLVFVCRLVEDAVGVLTSFMLLSLAAVEIRHITLTSTTRLGVALILILATFTAALSIQLTVLSATSPTSINTILTVPSAIALWSTIYLHLIIIIACLPSFRFYPVPIFLEQFLKPHASAAKQHKKSGRNRISTSQISNPRLTTFPSNHISVPPPSFTHGSLPNQPTGPLPPLPNSQNSQAQSTKCSATKKAMMNHKREALYALDEDVDESVKTDRRRGGIGWREVSFRQSTQEFLLGLFPKPSTEKEEEERYPWR